jgi:hypothetical protein
MYIKTSCCIPYIDIIFEKITIYANQKYSQILYMLTLLTSYNSDDVFLILFLLY